MRIIAGKHKGKNLVVPPGNDIRPTTDRVREAVFSSCASYLARIRDVDITQAFRSEVVLDAFAGSGACGFEALSRGAASATFADSDLSAIKALRKNADLLGYRSYGPDSRGTGIPGYGNIVKIVRRDVVWDGLPGTDEPYTLIFMDPPYAVDQSVVIDCLASASNAGIVAKDCLIAYECDKKTSPERFSLALSGAFGNLQATLRHFAIIEAKIYGRARIFYIRAE